MFHISFYVDDKNLGEAFKRLAGIARDLQHAYVPNVEPRKGPQKNGHDKPELKGTDLMELLTKEMHKRGMTEFKGPEFKKIIADIGMSTTSYSYFLNKLVDAGVVKKGKLDGNSMRYTVTGK